MFKVFYRTPEEARRGIPERYFLTDDAEEAYAYQQQHQDDQDQIVRVVFTRTAKGFSS
jgi:hypothetical protein